MDGLPKDAKLGNAYMCKPNLSQDAGYSHTSKVKYLNFGQARKISYTAYASYYKASGQHFAESRLSSPS